MQRRHQRTEREKIAADIAQALHDHAEDLYEVEEAIHRRDTLSEELNDATRRLNQRASEPVLDERVERRSRGDRQR